MKIYTKSEAYYEVRKVIDVLFRIFYCEKLWNNKSKEVLITSEITLKKATKVAKHLQEAFDSGYNAGNQ